MEKQSKAILQTGMAHLNKALYPYTTCICEINKYFGD